MNVSKKVAVIGAGAAGIAAAQRLKEAGFRVVVFEQRRIGGKCQTVSCAKAPGVVELGAIQVGMPYSLVNRYRKAVGMTLRESWPARALFMNNDGEPSQASYKSLSEYIWPAKDIKSIAREASVMSSALKRFKSINDSNFTDIPKDSEFLQPFEVWANRLSLPHFKKEYSIWMTAYGYGRLNEVPTFLALSLLNSSYGLIAMRKANMNLRILSEGYGNLLARVVEHYDLDVKTGTHVTVVERREDRIVIAYGNDQFRNIEEFGYMVVASGLNSIHSLLGELATDTEKKLVKDIRYSPYDVVIANVPDLDKGGYILPGFFDRLGHVVMISKNSSGGEEAILYVPRAGFQRPSWQELSDSVKEDLAHFGFKDAEILRMVHWDDYFPHFKSPESYELLNKIQGQNRTIIVGEIARFAIVERAMQHAHDMVDQHIKGVPPAIIPSSWIEPIKDYLSAKRKEQ